MRRLVTNFSSVTSVRPQDEAVAGANSQDDASDAEAFVGLDELDDVSITRRGGGCRRGGEQEEDANAAFSMCTNLLGRGGSFTVGRRL